MGVFMNRTKFFRVLHAALTLSGGSVVRIAVISTLFLATSSAFAYAEQVKRLTFGGPESVAAFAQLPDDASVAERMQIATTHLSGSLLARCIGISNALEKAVNVNGEEFPPDLNPLLDAVKDALSDHRNKFPELNEQIDFMINKQTLKYTTVAGDTVASRDADMAYNYSYDLGMSCTGALQAIR